MRRMMQTLALLVIIGASITYGIYLERGMERRNQMEVINQLNAKNQEQKVELDKLWGMYFDQCNSNQAMYQLLTKDERG